MKVVHFMSLKKWSVRDNFYDFIKFAATELESKDLIENMCQKRRMQLTLAVSQ